MATKPRHRKTPTQLWVYDNAKRLNLTDEDLGKATGVEAGTARSWFSRGKPNADAISVLEKLFGRPAPSEEEPTGLGSDVASAIRDQTQVLRELLDWLKGHEERLAAVEAAVALNRQSIEALGERVGRQGRQGGGAGGELAPQRA